MNRIFVAHMTLVLLLSGTVSCDKNDNYTTQIENGKRQIINRNIPKTKDSDLDIRFIRKIGDLESADENYMFYLPRDITRDKDGNYYILDSGNSRIQVFNDDMEFIRTIGRSGQGPVEFANPYAINLSSDDNLFVSDIGNKRIQVISNRGEYIDNIRCNENIETFLLSPESNIIINNGNASVGELSKLLTKDHDILKDRHLISVYNRDGFGQYTIGIKKNFDSIIMKMTGNTFNFCTDGKSIYLAYVLQNRIDVYGIDGSFVISIIREKPFDPATNIETTQEKKHIQTGNPNQFYQAVQVDDRNRIWAQSYKIATSKIDLKTENHRTDIFELEVYDREGVLLEILPLEIRVGTVLKRIVGNRLYFVNTYSEMCILEYEIVE